MFPCHAACHSSARDVFLSLSLSLSCGVRDVLLGTLPPPQSQTPPPSPLRPLLPASRHSLSLTSLYDDLHTSLQDSPLYHPLTALLAPRRLWGCKPLYEQIHRNHSRVVPPPPSPSVHAASTHTHMHNTRIALGAHKKPNKQKKTKNNCTQKEEASFCVCVRVFRTSSSPLGGERAAGREARKKKKGGSHLLCLFSPK